MSDASYEGSIGGTSVPFKAVAVDISSTDHDLTVSLPPFARRIYVGGLGDVIVKLAGAPSTAITYKAVPAGSWLLGAFVAVVKSGTTATNMVAEQ